MSELSTISTVCLCYMMCKMPTLACIYNLFFSFFPMVEITYLAFSVI